MKLFTTMRRNKIQINNYNAVNKRFVKFENLKI